MMLASKITGPNAGGPSQFPIPTPLAARVGQFVSRQSRAIPFMKRTNKCPKCGSTDVIADAKAIDRSHSTNPKHTEFSVATFRKPDAIIFKGQQDTAVSAWVCAECAFVELYADSPKALKMQDG